MVFVTCEVMWGYWTIAMLWERCVPYDKLKIIYYVGRGVTVVNMCRTFVNVSEKRLFNKHQIKSGNQVLLIYRLNLLLLVRSATTIWSTIRFHPGMTPITLGHMWNVHTLNIYMDWLSDFERLFWVAFGPAVKVRHRTSICLNVEYATLPPPPPPSPPTHALHHGVCVCKCVCNLFIDNDNPFGYS